MTSQIYVFVYLPGNTVAIPAGRFTHDSVSLVGSFEYGDRYKEQRNALTVDPIALPLGGEPFQGVETNGGLYGAFRDAAPDAWGRRVIAAQNNTTPDAFSEVEFLLSANASRVGNLDFRESSTTPEPILSPPHFQALPVLLDTAASIEAGTEPDPDAIRLFEQGTSMGGARPKCTVKWNSELWLAKFPQNGDQVNKTRIEYAAMRLASACGLDVAEVKIHTMGDKDILMVKRFDRRSSESGWLRSGFISALSLRQQDERDRGWDYRKISDLLSKHSSRSEANRTELFRRVVFNILIRNTDDHARNHGFLFNGPEIQLSPAYDLDPSITGNPGSGFTLTMDFGTAGRIATADNLFSSAARFGLDQSTARDIVDGIWDVAKEWKERFRQDGVSDSDIGKLDASFTNPGAR